MPEFTIAPLYWSVAEGVPIGQAVFTGTVMQAFFPTRQEAQAWIDAFDPETDDLLES
jgi:hypothetical protein